MKSGFFQRATEGVEGTPPGYGLVQSFCSKQGQLQQLAQGRAQVGFEYVQSQPPFVNQLLHSVSPASK